MEQIRTHELFGNEEQLELVPENQTMEDLEEVQNLDAMTEANSRLTTNFLDQADELGHLDASDAY